MVLWPDSRPLIILRGRVRICAYTNLISKGDVIRCDVEKPLRTVSPLALLSAAFNILNTWWGCSSTLIIGLPHGGPVTLVYGLLLMSLIYGTFALSLAELSAHYPTAGGQYHWTHTLSPKKLKRGLVSP